MKFISCLLLAGLLTSCLRFQSNINGTPPTFKRVLVVSKLPRISKNYLGQFARSFPAGYDICTLDAGPLSFGNPDSLIHQRARACQSDVILTLNASQPYQRGVGEYARESRDLLMEMSTATTFSPFWKGLATINSRINDEIAPDVVVRRLVRDQVLAGTLPERMAVN